MEKDNEPEMCKRGRRRAVESGRPGSESGPSSSASGRFLDLSEGGSPVWKIAIMRAALYC